MSNPADNIETARRYLKAIEEGATGAALAQFFAPHIVMELFPNRLVPEGSRSGLAEMLAGAERGQKVLTSQHYEIKHEVAGGDSVALEATMTATTHGRTNASALKPGFAVAVNAASGC